MIQNLLKAALEQALDSQIDDKESVKKDDPKREDEVVFYAVMTNPDGLRLADSKVTQQQCEIKVKNKGRVRVRKYSKEGLDPTFELTFKTKSNNAGIEGNIEQNNDINQNIFDGFRALCSEEMTKDRFCFPVKSIQITTDKGTEDVDIEGIFYEVDVFFNEDGSYNENIKIDLEVNKLLDYINQKRPDIGDFRLNVKIMDLPFKPHQVIIKDKNTTEEDKDRISELYKTVFLKKKTKGIANESIFDSLINSFNRYLSSNNKILLYLTDLKSHLKSDDIKEQFVISNPAWGKIFPGKTNNIDSADILFLLNQRIELKEAHIKIVKENLSRLKNFSSNLPKPGTVSDEDKIYSMIFSFNAKLEEINNLFYQDIKKYKVQLDPEQADKNFETPNLVNIRLIIDKLIYFIKLNNQLHEVIKDEYSVQEKIFELYLIDDLYEYHELEDAIQEMHDIHFFVNHRSNGERKMIHGIYMYIKKSLIKV